MEANHEQQCSLEANKNVPIQQSEKINQHMSTEAIKHSIKEDIKANYVETMNGKNHTKKCIKNLERLYNVKTKQIFILQYICWLTCLFIKIIITSTNL